MKWYASLILCVFGHTWKNANEMHGKKHAIGFLENVNYVLSLDNNDLSPKIFYVFDVWDLCRRNSSGKRFRFSGDEKYGTRRLRWCCGERRWKILYSGMLLLVHASWDLTWPCLWDVLPIVLIFMASFLSKFWTSGQGTFNLRSLLLFFESTLVVGWLYIKSSTFQATAKFAYTCAV